MATFAYTSAVVTAANNVGAVTLGANDLLYVGRAASLIATGDGSDGVRGTRGSSIIVSGEIFGTDDGIQITTNPTFQSGHVTVGGYGTVSGGHSAIHMTGLSGTVVNAGTLIGSTAIWFEDGSANVINNGSIYGDAQGEAIRFSDDDNLLKNYGTVYNPLADAIVGGEGTDTIENKGGIYGDVHLAGGNDRYVGSGLTEGVVYGDAGNDTLIGPGLEENHLDGGIGNDELRGGGTLLGGEGADKLFSKTSAIMLGGTGRDVLVGGIGPDQFKFAEAGNAHFDHIRKFGNYDIGSGVEDVIVLDNSYFRAIAEGDLSESAFYVGTAATTAAHRIVFDDTTGTIWYDKDGSGVASAARIAIIDSYESTVFNQTITHEDFLIV